MRTCAWPYRMYSSLCMREAVLVQSISVMTNEQSSVRHPSQCIILLLCGRLGYRNFSLAYTLKTWDRYQTKVVCSKVSRHLTTYPPRWLFQIEFNGKRKKRGKGDFTMKPEDRCRYPNQEIVTTTSITSTETLESISPIYSILLYLIYSSRWNFRSFQSFSMVYLRYIREREDLRANQVKVQRKETYYCRFMVLISDTDVLVSVDLSPGLSAETSNHHRL
jgi:hypothetical protein